jgi:EAL domain-containing protein (putative c-di-GMP-specific phosphodiesterase class I)
MIISNLASRRMELTMKRNSYHTYSNWWKVFLPLSHIRFFPPQFILRDPVIEGVSTTFKQGSEVAIIVFYIKNLVELQKEYGQSDMNKVIHLIRNIFRIVVEREVKREDLLLLDHYYSEGITLYIKVDHEQHCVSDIHSLMNKLSTETEKTLNLEMAELKPEFNKGYMFIDKNYDSLGDAIYKAHEQALIMAKKRVQTEYNEMVFALNKIVARKEIHLLAQPIIDMDTKNIIAWEMLTRGPKGTNLEMPLRLFSVARQTRSLYNLEMVVFEKSFEKIKETGCKQDIFVNCTPLTLGNKCFVEQIKQLMIKFPMINSKKIIIEMTEQDSIEAKKDLIENIRLMRELGFRFALDDTGAGYSSFHTISEILPEVIKIDRDVIENIHQSSVKESMLKGILLVAKEVGSKVVAEGIENKEEAMVLSRHKVDFAQGYYFARPDVFNKQLLTSLFGG